MLWRGGGLREGAPTRERWRAATISSRPTEHPCPSRKQAVPKSAVYPGYTFVVPSAFAAEHMGDLVGSPLDVRDPGGKLWDCTLVKNENKTGVSWAGWLLW